MLVLRAFKAVEEPDSCAKFLKGHSEILTNIGVNKVTSSEASWVKNPGTYVIVVEDPETGEVMGGARVDTTYGNDLLPIESATGYMDNKVYDMVDQYRDGGAGEICGLWNSRKVAGMGFGSLFLTRAAVVITPWIGVKTLFALCAPYTVATAEYFGYRTVEGIGNEGTFYYPKLDLLATGMKLENTSALNHADDYEKERVFSLRKDPLQEFEEGIKKRKVWVKYGLDI